MAQLSPMRGSRAGELSVRNAIASGVRMGAVCVNDVVDATERDAMLLARSETIAVLSPSIALESEARYPPARMLIDHGAAVALASGANPRQTCRPQSRWRAGP